MKASRFALAIGLLALVAWLVWTSIGSGRTSRRAVGASASSATSNAIGDRLSPSDSERTFTVVESPDAALARAPVVPASTPIVTRLGPASMDWNVGHLVVSAVDAATNETLPFVGARCVNDKRLADEFSKDPSGEIDLPLSSGVYSILVSARGYESGELPDALVIAGKTNRLEPARLRAGEGRIEVDVAGAAADGRKLLAELIGMGRHPCARCAEAEGPDAGADVAARAWQRADPCRSCGFARDRSRLPLQYGAYAEFADLASGSYALRIIDERGFSQSEPRDLLLRAGDSARVAFDLASQRTVRVECLDVDGGSLSEVWRLRLAEPEQEEGFRVVPISLSFSDAAGACIATAKLVPPAPHHGVWAFTSWRGGTALHRRPSFVDRARQPGEELQPQPTPAKFGIPEIACDVEHDGLARVGPLPSAVVAVHATAALFVADASVPESSDALVTLRLRSGGDSASAPPESATYSAYEMAQAK